MTEKYVSSLRDLINRIPIIKQILKKIFSGILKKKRKREIDLYNQWLKEYSLDNKAVIRQKKLADGFKYKPLISIITPTYNTPARYFVEMIESVLCQTYNNWELILVDDASSNNDIRCLIKKYSDQDPRIKYKFLKSNHHIAGATNEAIKIASGEFISLFDHDDILQIDALFEIVCALNNNKNIDFIYSDEDKISGDSRQRSDPFFKPNWNPDLLYSINYITHLTTIRKTILNNFGYEDGNYNGAQDWELFLRITRNIPKDKIHHIPKILYSWRTHEASTAMNITSKPYVVESQRKAIFDDLSKKRTSNYSLSQDALYPGQWQVSFRSILRPKVSIIVFNSTTKRYIDNNLIYENFEVLFFHKDYSIDDVLDKITGEYIIIVDMKINISNNNWIELLLGDANRSDIGFVVAKYRFNNEVIQSISPIINQHAIQFLESSGMKSLTKHYYITARYNIPKIKKGCVAIVSVDKVKAVMDDKNSNINIVDLSGVMALNGYRNLYNPYVKL